MNSGFEKAKLDIAQDVSVGDWIKDSLAPWIAFSETPVTVGIVIPQGFESYVLVRHAGESDQHGTLGNETLTTLIGLLSQFTDTPENCFHALWNGYGWMYPRSVSTFKRLRFPKLHRLFRPILIRFDIRSAKKIRNRVGAQVQTLDCLESHTLPVGVMQSEQFKLPNREYLLMCGPLSEARKIGWVFSESFHHQSPNLLWPSDRSWILATEIDFNVTLIAGSEKLIQTILKADSLTTQRFNVTDTIQELPVAEY